ncbi:hypothetical protein Anapl_09184 [Anas platyrhynchos]|uniref:Uncharacterized protein n=1 Tax=Anas platyrhynchos TaxID=8839 RepID=R0KMX0_ANAPL|nr:hypothetical protein Anapl_09184 [Anas platyrhynchos]
MNKNMKKKYCNNCIPSLNSSTFMQVEHRTNSHLEGGARQCPNEIMGHSLSLRDQGQQQEDQGIRSSFPGLLSQGEETNTEKINTSGRARTGPLISCGKLGNARPLPILRRVGGFDGVGIATGVGLGQPPSPLVKLHLAHTEKLLLEKGLSPPHQSSALVSEAKRHGS